MPRNYRIRLDEEGTRRANTLIRYLDGSPKERQAIMQAVTQKPNLTRDAVTGTMENHPTDSTTISDFRRGADPQLY